MKEDYEKLISTLQVRFKNRRTAVLTNEEFKTFQGYVQELEETTLDSFDAIYHGEFKNGIA